MLIERTILKQIVVMPNEKIIHVQWATQILRNDAVVSETLTRRAYASNDQAAFMAEVENSAAYVAAAGWAPLSSAPLMPADLAALALPDESLADLKVRLLTELTRLRSMAVGRLDMTDAERAMLTTLEGQVAQQWFSS